MGRPRTRTPKRPPVGFLRAWRDDRGLSQADLGNRLEPPVEPSTISRLEDGSHEWKYGRAVELAEALGITPFELLFVHPDAPGDFLRQWVATSPHGAAAIAQFFEYAARPSAPAERPPVIHDDARRYTDKRRP